MPDVIQYAPGLPKTRSGKIMRRILRKIALNDRNVGDTSTLADESIVEILFQSRPESSTANSQCSLANKSSKMDSHTLLYISLFVIDVQNNPQNFSTCCFLYPYKLFSCERFMKHSSKDVCARAWQLAADAAFYQFVSWHVTARINDRLQSFWPLPLIFDIFL